jgi:hypothetical protein
VVGFGFPATEVHWPLPASVFAWPSCSGPGLSCARSLHGLRSREQGVAHFLFPLRAGIVTGGFFFPVRVLNFRSTHWFLSILSPFA